jgi:ComF family protein
MFDLKNFVLDLFFPIYCFGCGTEGKWLCPDCLAKIKVNSDIIYFPAESSHIFGLMVASDYNQKLLESTLHAFKYNFVSSIGNELAEILCRFLKPILESGEIKDINIVIPIPLARKRLLWRGFNQAEIFATEICREFSWNLGLNFIERSFNTRPQVGLNAKQRLSNVKDIFKIRSESLLKNKNILLIDDVFTTGATMQECAKLLKLGGAKTVWGLVLAKG